jgi:NAD(P)H dehydrogenase (quinone)
MIAVTGATGHLGQLVIEGLPARVAASQIIAAKASGFARLGVQVREADCSRPETLSTAFHGVKRVLLISAADVNHRFRQHKAVIDAAKEAKVELLSIRAYFAPTVRRCSSLENTNKRKSTFGLPVCLS